ncbi:LytR/AlgR family response regulator transcription factor [Peribacillus acanthi]|uniref:LytR/AlgR family response regulator transcription factor n=1 Tax=Peribacillus acanthi TaxID=2171554 RepID=UPI000D3E167C|nr:LytTR family DNA-binding domain-containing protein [Peribacillus acanthi]
MDPIRTLIVDDNRDAVEILEYYISQFSGVEIIGVCSDGEEMVEEVMMKKPDLVLADINMPKKNGVDAIKECMSFHPGLKFIFITGYDEFAIEAFRLAAVDYIVKPVEKDRLYKAMEKARSLLSFERGPVEDTDEAGMFEHLPLKSQNCTRFVPLNDIFFIEKIGKKCLVYTSREMFETNETLGRIMERLGDTFFHGHRSFIINLKWVSHITPQNETFIVYFKGLDKQAFVSKLKINEMRDLISEIND